MPYTDRLRSVALWFQQLWAESLGKAKTLDGARAGTGPTPVAALGASDQHSFLQLLMEGPDDKVVLFIEVADHGPDASIPSHHPEMSEFAYLGGHTLGELLNTERRSTAEALRLAGRPNATFHMPRIGPGELGQLFMLLQIATVYAGALYRVDPLDQPGVELSKRLTYGLMGRVGVPRPEIPEGDRRWRI
jgi:glucose-6-phosphate isomerase